MQAVKVSNPELDLSSLMTEKPLLIDARKVRDGGIGIYTQNLISDLVSRNIPLAVLGDPRTLEGFDWAPHVRLIEERAKPYSADELIMLPRRVKFEEFSLLHVPHYTLPFRIPIPKVVTIHDLIHLTHPERRYYPVAAWGLIASSLLRADGVLTVSAAAQRDIERYFPRLLRRGAGPICVPNRLADGFCVEALSSGDSAAPFLFMSVSQPKPHKGVLDFLSAFAAAKDKAENLVARGQLPRQVLETELVVGGFGSTQLAHINSYERYLTGRSDVRVVGVLAESKLREFYRTARAVVVPSRAEGFGFPVIEAHSQGTPVIMRPVPALLELRTAHDFVAESFSIEALSDAILVALGTVTNGSAALRESALSFSSDRFIVPIMELYRAVIARNRLKSGRAGIG